MTTVTAAMVKELRERSGAGMSDCKTALVESNGEIDAAIDWLRKKGIVKAEKKSDRIAAQGLIGVTATGNKGALVEVNSETDFVARNDQFQDLVTKITALAPAANGDIAKLLAAQLPGKAQTVEVAVKDAIATIGENMNVRRTAALTVTSGVVAGYMHAAVKPNLGKIGVLVALESTGKNTDELAALAKGIAMHVAAFSPLSLDLATLPKEFLDRERAILAEKNAGKKPEVLEKIFQSSLKSLAKEKCLLDQVYALDNAKSVGQAVKDSEGKVGGPVTLTAYVRFGIGEGIEKKEEVGFAEEVARAVKG
jgi:elongation factor Ts